MLGHADDIQSVTGLLDNFAKEFGVSEDLLEELCKAADQLSSTPHPPPPASPEEIDQSQAEAKYAISNLTQICNDIKQIVQTLQTRAQNQTAELTNNQGQYMKEVLDWQNAIEKASNETLELEQLNFNVDHKLTELYRKLLQLA